MKAWDITVKDLKLLFRDGRTFVVLLALPVLFIYIIGMITGRLSGFDEPNRVLRIAFVDQIDYQAVAQDEDGEPLEEAQAKTKKKLARNLFAKLFNRIQEHEGLEVREVDTIQQARTMYENEEVGFALVVGPDFYDAVQRLRAEDVFNRDRGGVTLQFAPPEDDIEFAEKREGLERRLAQFLNVDPAVLGSPAEDVSLQERANFTFRLPQKLEEKPHNARPDEDTRNLAKELLQAFENPDDRRRLLESLKPLELQDVHCDGLVYRLLSLDMRLESDVPLSATHSVVEQLVWGDALATVSVVPMCANQYVNPRAGAMCDELEAEANEPPIELEPPLLRVDPESLVYQKIIPGYTVLFVFFLINIMARSYIHERSLGTLRRLRIAPLRPVALLAGKTLPFLFVSLVQTALLFVFGKLFFDMEWGQEPWVLLPVIFCTSLAATALGLLVATIVRTEAQVSAYANLVVITTGLVSGSMFPREWLSDLMKNISLATPHAWALIAYDEILIDQKGGGLDLTLIGQSCAALVGFALLFFVIGTLRFGKVD